MNFMDRLAGQARTAEQALRDFKPRESRQAIPLGPNSTDVSTEPEPIVPKRTPEEEALLYRTASGVGVLVKRLGLVLASDMGAYESNGAVRTFSKGTSFGPDYEIEAVDSGAYPLRKVITDYYRKDTDPVIDQVVWHKIGLDGSPGGERFFFGVYSYADGNIGFRGNNYGRLESIGEKMWSNNPDLVMQTLERYFDRDYGIERDYWKFVQESAARYYNLPGPSLFSHQKGRPYS